MFRSSASFAAIDQASSTICSCLLLLLLFVCYTLPHIVRFVLKNDFSTRLLSIPQLQSPVQSRLGVLLLSSQPSILVLLPCVDDFHCPCLVIGPTSFFVTLTFPPAVGAALSVLLILTCCWVCSFRLLLAVPFCSSSSKSASPLCSVSAICLLFCQWFLSLFSAF